MSTGSGSRATARRRYTVLCPRLAATLLGETPRFFHEHALVKEQDTHEATPWHHDEPYYCVDGDRNVSLWLPLDPVPRRGGSRVHRRLTPVGSPIRAAQVRRPLGLRRRVQATSSSFLISMRCAISTRSCRSTCNRATSSHFTTAPCIQRRVPPAERLRGDEPSASATSAATPRYATRPWLHSPPYESIVPGQPLDDDRFPLVSI